MFSPQNFLSKRMGRPGGTVAESAALYPTEYSTARTTDLWLPDHEGVLRSFGNAEVGYVNGRVVTNLVDSSEDITIGNWGVTNTATASDATTASFPAVGDQVRNIHSRTISVGDVYVARCVLSGSGTITIMIERGGGGTYEVGKVVITLTSTPTVYSISHTFANAQTAISFCLNRDTGNTATSVTVTDCQLENVTGQANQNPGEYVPNGTATGADLVTNGDFSGWADSTVPDGWTNNFTPDANNYVEENAAGLRMVSDGTYVSIYQSSLTTTAVEYYYEIVVGTITSGSIGLVSQGSTKVQINSTGTHTGTFTASGATFEIKRYAAEATDVIISSISIREATTGREVYATANGNSVTDNVVTESVGALLSPAPAIWCQPAATNLITYSHEFDNAAWVKTNATITADDTTAPDGTVTADVLGDDSSTGTGNVIARKTVSLSAATTYTFSVYAKQDQLDWLGMGIQDFTDPANGNAYFNLGSGAVGTTNPSLDSSSIESIGDGWYRCSIVFTTVSDTSGEVRVYVGEADNDVTVDLDGTSSVFIWGAQLEEGSTPTSYIPTSGATATANATEPVVTWPAGLVNDFVVKFKVTPDAASQGSIWLFGNYTDANNAFGVLHDGTNVIFRNRVSGSNNDTDEVLSYSADTEYEIRARHSSSSGLDVWVAGTKGTTDSTTTVVSEGTLKLGQDGNDASLMLGSIRDLKIYSVSPHISDAEVLAL